MNVSTVLANTLADTADTLVLDNITYQKQTVESRELQRTLLFFGNADYAKKYKIFLEEAGKLKEHFLVVGKFYEKDETMLVLENDDIQLSLLQNEADLLKAQQKMSSLQSGVRHGNISKQELNQLTNDIKILQFKKELAQKKYNFLTVKAPYSGTVLQVSPQIYISENQNITSFSAEQFIVEMVTDDTIVINATVSLSLHDMNDKNIKASIKDRGELFLAKIISIKQISEEKEDIKAILTVALPKMERFENIRPEMRVPIQLELSSHSAELTVPRGFIHYETDLHYCLVLRDNKISKVYVLTGKYDKTHIEVFGDLKPTDIVVKAEEN